MFLFPVDTASLLPVQKSIAQSISPRIDDLLNSGLEKLLISFDGLSKKTYEQYRIGADFYNVLKNLIALCERKIELGLKKPIIELQFICMKHNQHETKKLKKFQNRVKVDKIHIKTVAIPSWFYEGKDWDKLAEEFYQLHSRQDTNEIKQNGKL